MMPIAPTTPAAMAHPGLLAAHTERRASPISRAAPLPRSARGSATAARSSSAPIAAAPAIAEPARLGLVIHLAMTGVWAIRRDGRLVDVDGATHWESPSALADAARRAGIALSDRPVRTG